jgi:hypothetical protein
VPDRKIAWLRCRTRLLAYISVGLLAVLLAAGSGLLILATLR